MASTAAIVGSNNIYLGGEPLVILGRSTPPPSRRGLEKADFKRALWERAQVPLSRFDPSNLERFAVIHPAGFKDRPPETLAPIARDVDRHHDDRGGGRGGKALGGDPHLRGHALRHASRRGDSAGVGA